VKHDSSAGANDTIKTGCASLLFRDLAKHCDESRHVETCVSKREICCISLRVSDVVQTGGLEFAPSLAEHFKLKVEEFEMALWRASSYFNTEVS